MSEKIDIRGVRFDSVTLDEAARICREFVAGEGNHVVHTPNSEIVQLCVEKNEFYDVINSADLTIPDGAGVVLAAKILGKPLRKGKVAGVELGERVLADCAADGTPVYFLGGKPGVAERAAEKLAEKYKGLRIVGVHDGYFKDDAEIVKSVNESGAKVLFVCLGVPKQELWMKAHREKINTKLMLGLGGSLDVYAGEVKRAPKAFIKLKLEWLYRLMCEPKRIGRMMKLPKFIVGTVFCGERGS